MLKGVKMIILTMCRTLCLGISHLIIVAIIAQGGRCIRILISQMKTLRCGVVTQLFKYATYQVLVLSPGWYYLPRGHVKTWVCTFGLSCWLEPLGLEE